MERTLKRRAAAAAAGLALITGGAVLAGCGSSSSSSETTTRAAAAADASTQPANGIEKLPATEILSTSLAAGKAASSLTVKGTITEGGEETSLDLVLGTDAGEGTIGTQGVTLSTVSVDGNLYFKASGDGWATLLRSAGDGADNAAGTALGDLLGDKWLKLPANPDSLDAAGGPIGVLLATLGGLIQKDSLLEAFLSPDDTPTVKGTGDVNGTPVVFLDDSEGGGTLAIQTVGEPYPVQIKGTDSGSSGEINFTDWNAPVSVTAPTEVVDIGELATLGG
jgi:hypothetical protein